MELPKAAYESLITRGTILGASDFEDIDHEKFFVIIGVYDDCIAGFFFINSNIHPSIQKKPEQLAMQYFMKRSDYSFLKYDSFLCATNILTRKKSELAENIQKGTIKIYDSMKEEHLEDLLEKLRESKLFSKIDKKRFFY